MIYQEQTIKCVDCRAEFTWGAREHEFFADLGYAPPKRCKRCKDIKKTERQDFSNREQARQ
jgi:hypothetical protein